MTVPTPARWRKASRSQSTNSCVELAHTHAAVRDSKNPSGPVMSVPVLGLLAAVKGGWLDR